MIFKSPFSDVDIPKKPLTEFVFSRAESLGDKPALIDGPSGRIARTTVPSRRASCRR